MKGVKCVVVITRREYSEHYLDYFKSVGAERVFSKFSLGTANDTILNLFGLEKTENIKFVFMLRENEIERIFTDLKEKMNIGIVGNGIAFSIPVDSIGGEVAKNYFLGKGDIDNKEKDMEEKKSDSKYVLIITVCDKGNTEKVMDAARSVGASGGTVVNALGTGEKIAKIFGITISEEKEMIYVVAKRDTRNGIMHAIMEKVGADTEAHGVVFSLPVDEVCGIKNLDK